MGKLERSLTTMARGVAVRVLGPRRATALAERTASLRGRPQPRYSSLGEEKIIHEWISRLRPSARCVVDIGASDGWSASNTYFLFKRGWGGVAVECDATKFGELARTHRDFRTEVVQATATPLNVVELLEEHHVPKEFALLSIDIDSYDYFVLDALLQEFRPRLVCAEKNEKIPPPLEFTVKWDPEHAWRADHFFGQSISQLAVLAERHGYALVDLHYNNAFLVPAELSDGHALTAELAYDRGYALRPDRAERFPWNADVDAALDMTPAEAEEFFRAFFAQYDGKYELELGG
jgi:hypothetical protein